MTPIIYDVFMYYDSIMLLLLLLLCRHLKQIFEQDVLAKSEINKSQINFKVSPPGLMCPSDSGNNKFTIALVMLSILFSHI